MKSLISNLNWLFLLLVIFAAALGFFYLPLFWKIVNVGILSSLSILVLYNAVNSFKANSALNIEQERLKGIIANLRDGVMAYDQDFKILIFNQAAEQIFDLKASEIVNQSFTLKIKQGASPKLKPLLTILFPALAPMIVRHSEPGAYPQIIDISFDEPPMELRIYTHRITNENGEVIGFVKIIHDRTRELTLLRTKSRFITIASHQLRTPLTAINWIVENLKKEKLEPSAQELVISAGAATNQLLKITEDLLDVSKIEEGQFGYKFQEFDIVEFLEEALTQARQVANQYNVRLYFEKPAGGPVTITGDKQKLAMVVANLLDNAVKYNIPNGEVAVKAENDQQYIVVSVRDTGIGMPEEALSKLFTKFFRAENAAKLHVEGTGLGLYIAKNIIRRHGGKIWAESTLNRGTTFYFTLPTNPTLIPAKEIIYEDE